MMPAAFRHALVSPDSQKRLARWFEARSRVLAIFLDLKTEAFFHIWIGAVVLIGLLKIMASPIAPDGIAAALVMLLPFLLVAGAPIAGYRLAQSSFPRGLIAPQPSLRLSRYGKWRSLDIVAARRDSAFGPNGFLASLVFGILLNVPFRSVEYLLAVPAMSLSAPGWALAIGHVMTFDVVVMNFLYMVCFVMALRSVPLFPRMLLFVWIMDIVMQLLIARYVAGAEGLPASVVPALRHILEGNIQKVLISAVVWLPYLILSHRVNLTFRHRVRA